MPKSQTSMTTGHSRRHRHGPVLDELGFPSRFVSGAMASAPAVAAVPPRPFGDLSAARAADIAELVAEFGGGSRVTVLQRRSATHAVLDYLAGFDGRDWQQRWDASPLGQGEFSAAVLGSRRTTGHSLPTGVRTLFCLRVIQPSLLAFRRQAFGEYNAPFVDAQSDPLLDKAITAIKAHDVSWSHRRDAISDLCCLLTVQGVSLADVTPPALLHFAHANRAVLASMRPGNKAANRFAGRGAWNVLHRMGHFPAATPQTMREAMHRGQQTIPEIIDRYPIRNQAVRQLLIDYFTRRRADTDYASLVNLILHLAHHFWEKIERLNPEQVDLHIAPDLYTTWREHLAVRDDGKARATVDQIIIGVRSFYLDLHTWAAEEPERWAIWVAPCPVPPSELRGLGKRRRRINERSADRTRVRQPLLPTLVAHVEERYEHHRRLLELAAPLRVGETFVLDGRSYRRHHSEHDIKRLRAGHEIVIRVIDETSGTTIHASAEEESAFWAWACVETLRHSGVRIEELCELTQLSIRQYQRANGEVIALLVIAPSKTDRERVIPMSAELFHIIATIVRRHARDGKTIPLVRRFDPHDKVWSVPLPFLFQRLGGSTRAVIGSGTVLTWIRRICAAVAEYNPTFRGLRFTPHDFRRIFATELVNSGLPIHIGAALLGHLNVQTTRGYVAVFDEDVVRHYQAHLQQRRQIRPQDEYASVTPQEWAEFEEHFDKRKVELGSCARPYGTPCQHEHACIRCPMLHVNPKMIDRLGELEHDLTTRRQHAENENWLGEIEGIDLTLNFLRTKREEAQRLTRRPLVQLGLPQPRGDNA
ncbi:tyrosine-type recombinase/integrase [Micromonospora sp. NPDC005324]|uniref:tyrosine-type recombinase/integrase n=1 Tax=Micromonospora sp. NPDC005324 TaxID=3157033 RepID=UPI0033BC843C